MKKEYHFSIINDGPFGIALAGLISHNRGNVSLLEPFKSNNTEQSKKIKLTGEVDITTTIDNVIRNFELITKSDIIVLTVPGAMLNDVFKLLVGNIRNGQHIILFPGIFGAITLKNLILKNTPIRDFTISEATSIPFLCSMVEIDTVKIHKFKNELKLATCPYTKNNKILDILNTFFNTLVPAKNLLETSLENINSVLHPLPILLNLVEIEKKGSEFKHFIDGINPAVSRLIDQMDRERLEVGTAFSLNLVPVVDQLKRYYGHNESKTVYEYVNNSQSPYKGIKGFGLNSRYIMDDIPNLVVATSSLGEIANVKTPLFNMCIDLTSIIMETDYRKNGINLQKLNLERKTTVRQVLKNIEKLV